MGPVIVIYVNVFLTVTNADDVAEIKTLLSEQQRLSRREPGCERFEVYHSKSDPRLFILNEHWSDQAAINEHRKATAYTTIYQPKVLPRVDRVSHLAEIIE